MDASKLEVAARAAYPELWPDNWRDLPSQNKAALAVARQTLIDRLGKAFDAVEQLQADGAALNPLADFQIGLPEDAAMVQQVLTTITYINTEGRTAYVVRTMGEGLRVTWLGMCVLTQDYLLKLPGSWASEK